MRYLRRIAFNKVEIHGLHKDWCTNCMLLASLHMVCAKKVVWVDAKCAVASAETCVDDGFIDR